MENCRCHILHSTRQACTREDKGGVTSRREEIPPPSAFQDVGKAAKFQREGNADKAVKAIHQWKILFRPLSAPFITPVVRVSLAIGPFVVSVRLARQAGIYWNSVVLHNLYRT